MQLKDKKISVIGMGRSGIAAANFLAGRGARTTLLDRESRETLQNALASLHPDVQTRFGSCSPEPDSDAIVLSPGVDIAADFLDPARERGIEIISEIELASRFVSAPIVAVTGTNGKSTCCTLIGNILTEAGEKALLGGNIGTPFISLVDQEPADRVVVEISSFQLEAVDRFHPQIAAVLNITPDHLDRHKTLARYIELKERIAANQTPQDFLILNLDDPHTRDLASDKSVQRVFFSTATEVEEGAFLRGGKIVVRLADREREICSVGELRQNLQWQVENALAAALTATVAGVDPQPIANAMREFGGMEHRMEWVRTYKGIDFVNNSKGTNVGAVEKSLAHITRPVILIAGGKDKSADFSPLKNLFREKVKHLVLMGETKTKFRGILNGSFSYEEAASMEDAVQRALARAASGDVVLLSPACASFDMFRDYADRGEQFKNVVHDL